MVTFSTVYWLTLYLNNKIFMKINTETKYCQTCGIPLDIDYTNLEANQNVEYCDYCLHNGVKLYDFSMDYLIYLWGLFPEEYYKETRVNLTSEELRAEMSKRLPNIKRWKLYRHIYLDWLPISNYTLREQFTLETYINTPEKTPASELITDIYIPITKKET